MTSGELRYRGQRPNRARQSGVGYLLVLFTCAALGLTLAKTGEVWHTTSVREKETQLMFVGQQFSTALASYRDRSPPGLPTAPSTLEELLEDSRFVIPVRHLRRIWRDPFTNEADWEVVTINGRIVGIHSRMNMRPLRSVQGLSGGSNSAMPTYRDWVFSAGSFK